MKRVAILTTILLVLPAMVHAAEFAKVGTFGGQFLKIGTSARATGMGSAFTGVADDATSVFWNPGGLVNVLGNEVSLNHVVWPADIKLSSVVVAFNPPIDSGDVRAVGTVALDGPAAGPDGLQPRGNGGDLRLRLDDLRSELLPFLHRQVLRRFQRSTTCTWAWPRPP